jgi:uncharacterized protein (DUF488 family)
MREGRGEIIFAIGHSTRSAEEFVDILKAHGVTLLVDIRTIPKSRHNPQFNGDFLERKLNQEGLGYIHMKELGGLRRPKGDSLFPNLAWKNQSFRGYADYMQTREFRRALDRLIILAKKESIAIMCAEGNPYRCHRLLLSDALIVRGVRVVHISSRKGAGREHHLTSFAKVIDGLVFYPVPEPEADQQQQEEEGGGG